MTIDLTKSPKVAALCEKVGANQNIADWVAKRPKNIILTTANNQYSVIPP
jgi:hypothetical protein